MYVLYIVFVLFGYREPATSVAMQEFTSQERCESAKDQLVNGVKSIQPSYMVPRVVAQCVPK
jgi:hypothetical protein